MVWTGTAQEDVKVGDALTITADEKGHLLVRRTRSISQEAREVFCSIDRPRMWQMLDEWLYPFAETSEHNDCFLFKQGTMDEYMLPFKVRRYASYDELRKHFVCFNFEVAFDKWLMTLDSKDLKTKFNAEN